MSKFRKKPVVIDAVQWSGENISEVMDLCAAPAEAQTTVKWDTTTVPPTLTIHTLENTSDPLTASIGDFIIRGVKGEIYPCKPDIFTATYDIA